MSKPVTTATLHGSSVVECLTQDLGAAGSSLHRVLEQDTLILA